MLFKFSTYLLTCIILLFTSISTQVPSHAATIVNGTFVNATYEKGNIGNNTTEKKVTKITLLNDYGQTITLDMDKYTPVFINSTSTTIEAFKEGMWVQASVEMQKVIELEGFTDIPQGETNAVGEYLTGTVNEIDSNGRYIAINMKDKKSKRFYLDQQTEVFKDDNLVDLSVLFEGDRVKLQLSDYDTDLLSSIEIILEGVQVEHIYKGTIQQIDVNQKKLLVKNESVFQNWNWNSVSSNKMTSRPFTAKTPIYLDNKKIDISNLRTYVNSEVYYVTIIQNGKEVIQKIVITQKKEKMLHETLNSNDISSQKIRLSSSGSIPYHKGSIIIRNGRLVDASALSRSGDTYVFTNGSATKQYANIIYMTNDSFQSPSLSNHTVYFGQISAVGSNHLVVTNMSQLLNNYWYPTGYKTLDISNSTVVKEEYNSSTTNFTYSTNKYAYFYVKDNHVVAAHIVGSGVPAPYINIGRYQPNTYPNYIDLSDVIGWRNGSWTTTTPIYNLDIYQTTFIKDGKVVQIGDLKNNDRLYVIQDYFYSGAHIIFAD